MQGSEYSPSPATRMRQARKRTPEIARQHPNHTYKQAQIDFG